MNRNLTRIELIAIAVAVLFIAFAPTQLIAEDAVTQPWCQIDDPAAYRKAREALIKSGERDLTKIACPARRNADGGLPEELSLPMPCGRSMLFRRVDIPIGHVLDHIVASFGRQVELEQETVQSVMSNGPWRAPVGGGFTLADGELDASSGALAAPKSRAYYIGKYEVTEPQIMLWRMGLLEPGRAGPEQQDPLCSEYNSALSELNLRFVNAAGGLSWYDAIELSRNYMAWLTTQEKTRLEGGKPPALPWEQGASGVVRLPTEAEWEYAARGGATEVSPQSRSVRVPRIRDPETGDPRDAHLDDVCADSPSGREARVGAVGRKAANLLGLHDTLCNAEEIVLDLFRSTRPDELHGQVGGYTTKGGSSKLLREQNAVGMRREKELFRLDGEQRIATNGVRLAIATPVFVGRRDSNAPFEEGRANQPLDEALLAGRKQLLSAGVGVASESRVAVNRDVADLRDRLKEESLDRVEMQQRVAELEGRLGAINTELREGAVEAARQRVRAGVVSASLIDRVGRNLYNFMQQAQKLRKKGNTALDPSQWSAELNRNNGRIRAAFDLYIALQGELAGEPEAFVIEQFAAAREGLSGASVASFGNYLEMLQRHQTEIRGVRGNITEGMRTRWLGEIDSQRDARLKRFPEYQ